MSTFRLDENLTLTQALSAVKSGDVVYLADKTYREKVVIDVPDLTIVGKKNTRIVYGDYANKIHADGKEYNTFRTFTVMVTAKNVTMKDLTIENDASNPAVKGQEVALSVYADGFYAENVTLISTQDTLFCGPLPDDLITRYIDFLPYTHRYLEGTARQVFYNCSVMGSVDYVFGCGTTYFLNCEFLNVDDGRDKAFVVAPAHSLKQTAGFTFIDCLFKKQGDFESAVYLARPWRDYGKATFINCRLGDITPEIFDKWNDTERDRTARFEVYPASSLIGAVSWAKPLDRSGAKRLVAAAKRLKDRYRKR
ncbi:MAG: pectin esterase [Clostridia bacterium]|nr:pectin esterase [Clostridia bacterium]